MFFSYSLHGESKPPDVSPSPNLISHETHLILEKEHVISFVPYPPSFSAPMQVPPCDDHKVGKSANQIPNLSSHPSFTFHDSDPMEEILEWFMNPMVKNNLSIPQDDIITHNLNIESDLDTCHHLPCLFHDTLSLNMTNQFIPNRRSK